MPKIGVAAIKISDNLKSKIMDIMIAPMQINGARITRRISIATAICSWFTSLVILLISVGVPNVSSSAYDKDVICLNILLRSVVPNPCDARAA
ncbi:hypothetical protein D3C78_1364610 [compost metagenome]